MNTTFNSASEVRAFLKAKGIVNKVAVKLTHNPFGGEDKYAVVPATPKGVGVAYRGDSQGSRLFFSDDGGKTAGIYNAVREALSGTNAFVG